MQPLSNHDQEHQKYYTFLQVAVEGHPAPWSTMHYGQVQKKWRTQLHDMRELALWSSTPGQIGLNLWIEGADLLGGGTGSPVVPQRSETGQGILCVKEDIVSIICCMMWCARLSVDLQDLINRDLLSTSLIVGKVRPGMRCGKFNSTSNVLVCETGCVFTPHQVNHGGVQKSPAQVSLYKSDHTTEEPLRRRRSVRYCQVLSSHSDQVGKLLLILLRVTWSWTESREPLW